MRRRSKRVKHEGSGDGTPCYNPPSCPPCASAVLWGCCLMQATPGSGDHASKTTSNSFASPVCAGNATERRRGAQRASGQRESWRGSQRGEPSRSSIHPTFGPTTTPHPGCGESSLGWQTPCARWDTPYFAAHFRRPAAAGHLESTPGRRQDLCAASPKI
jgi:hypothetical protein